jgi:hypothetical protein
MNAKAGEWEALYSSLLNDADSSRTELRVIT